MKKILLVMGLMVALVLGACTSTGSEGKTAATDSAGEVALLNADYDNALSVQGQLALGTRAMVMRRRGIFRPQQTSLQATLQMVPGIISLPARPQQHLAPRGGQGSPRFNIRIIIGPPPSGITTMPWG